MSGQPLPSPDPKASSAEMRATQKIASAQAAVNRTFGGTLLKLAAAGGVGYTLWYMWQKSEEPLPKPVGETLSKMVTVGELGSGGMQQQVEQVRGTYPGSAGDVPSKGNPGSKR